MRGAHKTWVVKWALVVLSLCCTVACNDRRRVSYRTYAMRTPSGAPLHWLQPTIVLQPIRPLQKVSEAVLTESLEAEIELWNEALAGCRVPRLALAKTRSEFGPIKQDGISSIVVRASEWCPDGSSNDASCYEHRLEALTTVYPNEYGPPEEKGVIREADIEINAVDMKWSSDGSVPGTHSLRATIAHELGHVLGLDDACNTPNTLLARGNRADLAPLCTSQDVRTSIMYPDPNVSSRPSVLKPGTSEVDFLCESYAAGSTPR